jgi:hypothetical protein
MMELIKAYEEYIEILGSEIDELSPLAILHGWKSSKIKNGEMARNKIKMLKYQYLNKGAKNDSKD